jgi:Na+-transporting NADH:ubiquinone oxidoreductase subunit B
MRSALERFFERLHPHVAEGGKAAWAWPLVEGVETFLLTPGAATPRSGTHLRDPMDLKRLMMIVVYAILPAMVAGMWSIGHTAFVAEGVSSPAASACLLRGAWHMLPIVVTSYAVGGAWELLFCVVRKHEINEGFLVTGLLFPLTLAPTTPLWIVAAGVSFGVVIGKEVFGGTGYNILNPALTARALVFFAYPSVISGARVWDVAGRANPLTAWGPPVDGYTGATSLLAVANAAPGSDPVAAIAREGWTWTDLFLGLEPGSMAEVSAAAALVGAAVLIVTGVGSWRIMAGSVVGLIATSALFNALAGATSPASWSLPPHWHLVCGSFAFGTVYMATDPVSAAQTQLGRWLYGFGVGAMIVLIRVANPAYPEGVMLSILFMNVFAPLIDYVVIQRSTAARRARLADGAASAPAVGAASGS